MSHVVSPKQDHETLTVLFVGTPMVDIQAACESECDQAISIDVVTDGRTAIQRLTTTSDPAAGQPQPDLVLLQCDFELPNGMTVLHAIKSSPRLGSMPVVVLDTDNAAVERTYETDGNAHVKTPDTPGGYVDLVESITRFWFEWAEYPAEYLSSDTS